MRPPMYHGSIWKTLFIALLIYAVAGVIFWGVVSVLLAEKRRFAMLVNLAVGLFLLIFFCLYQLIHQTIKNYHVVVQFNDNGDTLDGRNICAVILAGVFTYVIVRLYYGWLNRK